MPRRGQDKIGNFWMPRSKVRFPEIFASVLFVTHGTAKPSQLGIVLGQVDDDVGAVGSRVAAHRAQVLLDRLGPNVLVPENGLAFTWLMNIWLWY